MGYGIPAEAKFSEIIDRTAKKSQQMTKSPRPYSLGFSQEIEILKGNSMLNLWVKNGSLGVATLVSILAGGASAQPNPADTAHYVMADFESNIQSTPLNGYWFTYTDVGSASAADTALKGNSVITSLDSSGNPFFDTNFNYDARTYPLGRLGDSNTHALHMGFALGDRPLGCGDNCSYAPYVGWGLNFTTRFSPNNTLDFTGATAFSFWAKSDSDTVVVGISFNILDTNARNAADYGMSLKIGPVWKKYTISLGASTPLTQPTWTTAKAFDLKSVTGIGFSFNKGSNPLRPTNGIVLDDVLIENWKFVEPVIEPEPEPEPLAIHNGAKSASARKNFGLQFHDSQMHFLRANGTLIRPMDLKGRALPVR